MCGNGQGCCAGSVIAPSRTPIQNILQVVSSCEAMGGGCVLNQRPTADALDKCEHTYAALGDPMGRGRYVILLTGGDPTCGGAADAGNAACDSALGEVTRLNNQDGALTAVFGVGDEAAGSSCLDQLALAGGLSSATKAPSYHLTLTPTDLSQALTSVVRTIADEACHIDVNSPPVDPDNVALLLSGVPLRYNTIDGWTFDPGSTVKITLHGSACDMLVQQMGQLELVSGCMPPRN
jgi:hypothetical protein